MKLSNISLTMILITASILLGGCTEQTSNNEKENQSGNLIEISKDQFNSENMQLEKPMMHLFSEIIQTNGIVSVPPQSKAVVNSYISGMVNSISVTIGSYVKKGEVLCTLQSKEFISLQQQYLESIAMYNATKSNYQRIKSLYKENISSKKSYFEIESQYKILVAKIKALKAQLKILKVNIQRLEDGELSTYLQVLSPIDGYITQQNCMIGQFIDSQKVLMKIINNNELQINFTVYPKTINKLKEGQSLVIYTADNPTNKYNAKIISVGKAVDTDTKSIVCIANIKDTESEDFLTGMYLQVDIIIENIELLALPSESIIKNGNNHYILVKEKQDNDILYFKREAVKTGLVGDGYTQIIGFDNMESQVLTNGTYYYPNK